MTRCLVLLLDAGPPKPILRALDDRGVQVTVCDGGAQLDTIGPADWSGLVAVGGRISPYDTRTVPFGSIGSILARGVARGIPTLGIGGGAHVLSAALGGTPSTPVADAPIEVRALTLHPAAADDVLFRHAPADPAWLDCSLLALWNLPVGATVLAVGEDGRPEAVALGPNAWALQGHPHLDRDTLEHCMASVSAHFPLPASARADVERAAVRLDEIQESWAPVLDRFCDLVCEDDVTRRTPTARIR